MESKRGEVVGREDIIEKLWGENGGNGISDHALDQIISRLRKKLNSSDSSIHLDTLRGRGYRII